MIISLKTERNLVIICLATNILITLCVMATLVAYQRTVDNDIRDSQVAACHRGNTLREAVLMIPVSGNLAIRDQVADYRRAGQETRADVLAASLRAREALLPRTAPYPCETIG